MNLIRVNKRRDRLVEIELFTFPNSKSITNEYLKFKDNFMGKDEASICHDILLEEIRDF